MTELDDLLVEISRRVAFAEDAVLCDTPELAERYGVRLGDTVMVYRDPVEFIPWP